MFTVYKTEYMNIKLCQFHTTQIPFLCVCVCRALSLSLSLFLIHEKDLIVKVSSMENVYIENKAEFLFNHRVFATEQPK